MSLLYSLSISGQSLLTFKDAINITNNLSNAFTDGYSKEEPILGGSYIVDIRRATSKIVFERYVKSNNEYEGLNNYKDILTQVEDVFNETSGTGFGEAVNQFFATLNDIKTQNESLKLKFSNLVSTIEDADFAEVTSNLQQSQTAYQVMLAAIAGTKDLSLLNFIK